MVETPERALVVIPRPNDAEFWCGGTVARWAKEGSDVFFLLCTDGGKGTSDPEMTPDRLAPIREQEQRDAAGILGVREVVTLGYPDGELEDNGEFRGEVVRAVRRFRPDVVLCPEIHRRSSPWHRDYRIAGQVTADAAYPYARPSITTSYWQRGWSPIKLGWSSFGRPTLPTPSRISKIQSKPRSRRSSVMGASLPVYQLRNLRSRSAKGPGRPRRGPATGTQKPSERLSSGASGGLRGDRSGCPLLRVSNPLVEEPEDVLRYWHPKELPA